MRALWQGDDTIESRSYEGIMAAGVLILRTFNNWLLLSTSNYTQKRADLTTWEDCGSCLSLVAIVSGG